MRVLVTGAGGFVGKHLCEALVANGDEPIATERHAGGALQMDVTQPEEVRKVLLQEKPDAIVHLAAIAFVPQAESDFGSTLNLNVGATDNLCRIIAENLPGCKFVFASSPEVYGKVISTEPISENQPVAPANNYGISKAAAELVVQRWMGQGVATTVIRPFNHIGPRQEDRYVTSSFARQLALIKLGKMEPTMRVGNLEAERDFTDVRDIVKGYLRACHAGTGIYQLCSGVGTSVQAVLDSLIEISGMEVRVEQDPDRMRKADIPRFVGNPAKANKELGWKQEIGLNQTLKNLFDYWVSVEA